MRILVLGGNGFVGYNFVKKMSLLNHEITSFDRNFTYDFIEGVRYIEGNYNEISNHKSIFKNLDVVYQFISTTLPKDSNLNPIFDIETNLCNLIKLLDLIVENNIKKIVFISSGGTVYGDQNLESISEQSSTDPLSSYGIVKLAMEKYIQLYSKLYGVNYSIFRLSNPYGPYQNTLKDQGIIGIFIRKFIENGEITIWGDGNIIRDYIYIDDVIEILNRDLMKNIDNNILLNLGSGKGSSINEILNLIERISNKKINILYKESRSFDVKKNILNIDKISNTFDWKPKHDIEEGIQNTYKWLKNNYKSN